MKSLQGQLLLDGGSLTGSEFHRTVVLVCIHNADGAFGLVLNRPSPHSFGAALGDALPQHLHRLSLFCGGPVQPQMLSCLVHDPAFSPNAKGSILPGLRLVHDPADLPDNTDAVKFFAGYAGWAPGQLDGELKAKAWLTHPATLAHVFDPRPEEQWRTILRGKGLQYRLLADAPEDVSLN